MIKKLFSNPLVGVGLGILLLAIITGFVLLEVQLKMERSYQVVKSNDGTDLISVHIRYKINRTIDESIELGKKVMASRYLQMGSNRYDFVYASLKDEFNKTIQNQISINSISLLLPNNMHDIEVSKKNYESKDVEVLGRFEIVKNDGVSFIKLVRHSIKNSLSLIIRTPITQGVSSLGNNDNAIEIDVPLVTESFEQLIDSNETIIIVTNDGRVLKTLGRIDRDLKSFIINKYRKAIIHDGYFDLVSVRDIEYNVSEDYGVIINGIDIMGKVSLIHVTSYRTDSADVMELVYYTVFGLLISAVLLIVYLRSSLSIHVEKTNENLVKSLNDLSDNNFKSIINKEWQLHSVRDVQDAFNELGGKLLIERKKYDILANKDEITGLLNRRAGFEAYQELIEYSKQTNSKFSTFYINIENFKSVNSLMGQDVGDSALIAIADRLNQVSTKISLLPDKEGFILARLNGDEFMLVVKNMCSKEDIEDTARKIIGVIELPLVIDNSKLALHTNIGVTVYPYDGDNISDLTKNADLATSASRSKKGKGYAVFDIDMRMQMERISFIKSEISNAVERNEFELVYQPQFTVKGRRIVGVESLVRWQHPEAGLIMPAEFIPIAEATGQIKDLGFWILRNACIQNKAWQRTGLKPIKMAVNVSIQQLRSDTFIEQVRFCLDESGLESKYLDLEITESEIMEEDDDVINTLKALQAIGVCLSIDDFGTGQSSLARLKSFPLDKIKIDRSFTTHITENDDDLAIIKAIVVMGKTLGLEILVEGIETEEQFQVLKELQCEQVQGYMLSQPVPHHKVLNYFKTNMAKVYEIGSARGAD